MEGAERLNQKCAELGIEANPIQLKKLLRWTEQLQKWNRTYNLTAIKDENKIIDYLVVGSIVAIPYLQGDTVLDVGSGSGVPGIPLAIFAPDYRYTLIDGNGKKIRFLEHCRMLLELPNIEVRQVRAEDFEAVIKYDIIISRALSSLDRFISTTLHLGHKQTRWLAFKGKISELELRQLRNTEADLGLRHSLKKLDAKEHETQNLVIVRY